VQTRTVLTYADHHPVDRLYRAGVPLSINTDTTPIPAPSPTSR
jgi:adenosine deaminase